MDEVQIEVGEHFKYLGTLKSADGNCNNDIKSLIGMTKKRMLDMVGYRSGETEEYKKS